MTCYFYASGVATTTCYGCGGMMEAYIWPNTRAITLFTKEQPPAVGAQEPLPPPPPVSPAPQPPAGALASPPPPSVPPFVGCTGFVMVGTTCFLKNGNMIFANPPGQSYLKIRFRVAAVDKASGTTTRRRRLPPCPWTRRATPFCEWNRRDYQYDDSLNAGGGEGKKKLVGTTEYAVAVGQPSIHPADCCSECLQQFPTCRGFAVNEVGGIHYCYFKNTFNQMPGGGAGGVYDTVVSYVLPDSPSPPPPTPPPPSPPPPSPPPPSPPPPSPPPSPPQYCLNNGFYKEDRGVNALGIEGQVLQTIVHTSLGDAGIDGQDFGHYSAPPLGVEECCRICSEVAPPSQPPAPPALPAPSPPPMTPDAVTHCDPGWPELRFADYCATNPGSGF